MSTDLAIFLLSRVIDPGEILLLFALLLYRCRWYRYIYLKSVFIVLYTRKELDILNLPVKEFLKSDQYIRRLYPTNKLTNFQTLSIKNISLV